MQTDGIFDEFFVEALRRTSPSSTRDQVCGVTLEIRPCAAVSAFVALPEMFTNKRPAGTARPVQPDLEYS